MPAARPLAALTAIGLAALAAAPAPAQEVIGLTIVAGHAPVTKGVAALRDHFIPEVNRRLEEAGGAYEVEWTQAYAGAVADYKGVLEAVETGIADLGYVPHLFEGDKLPLEQITYVTPFGTDDLPKLMEVVEKLHQEIPEMDGMWRDNNQMVLAPIGIDAYHFVTDFPVETLEDLENRKLGTAGLALNWLKGSGATPVALALPTFYNSMSTGLVDGIITFETAIAPYKFYEVAPHITKINFGAQYASALTVNLDRWEGFPQEVKDAIQGAADSYLELVAQDYYTSGAESLKTAEENGATIHPVPAEMRQAYADGMPNIARQWAEDLDSRGLPGTKTLETYMRLSREAGIDHARDWAAGAE